MIKSFAHKGLERFYNEGNQAGIQAQHAKKLRRILIRLEVATGPDDLDLPGFRLHELKGNYKGIWSITVQANWRITFRFVEQDVEIVNYEDYH
jgi:proteic killer suppression protein